MNKNVIGVEISGIRKFYNEVVKFPEAISLTLGQPDFPVPEKVKEAMIRAIEEGKTTYTANAGIVELREEISSLLKNNFDIDFPVPYFVISHCSTLLKKPYTLGVAFERRLLTAACALTI